MRTLVILNKEQVGHSLKRYFNFLYNYKSVHILMDDYIDLLPKDFYEYNIYLIDIFGSENNAQCTLGLHVGKLLENQQKNIIYFYTHSGLRNTNSAVHSFLNCFYLPGQLKEFLDAIKKLPIQGTSATDLLKLFESTSITSGHH